MGVKDEIKKIKKMNVFSELASRITNYFKPRYVELYRKNRVASQRLLGYLLNAYVALGYKRTDKLREIRNWPYDKDK